jgi:histidinol dehydrogenase
LITVIDTGLDDVFGRLRRRTIHRDDETTQVVAATIEDVRRRGDAALIESAGRFDAPNLENLRVSEEEWRGAVVEPRFGEAIRQAKLRIQEFHEGQLGHHRLAEGRSWSLPRTSGSVVGQRYVPLARVGVYVPGGNAAYPSSVLMNAIPALVAGVSEVVVTTPARRDGSLHPAVHVARRELGLAAMFKVGGAAAVAAMALGTESVPRVDKIVGPGNRFVNEAKRQLWGQVGLDGYAGPSEVCVLADDEANVAYAAADLLTQVEHAPDNAGFLVCLSRAKLDAILAEADRQLAGAPRETTMRAALRENSLAIVARDLSEAIELTNAIAPEHLTLALADPEAALPRIHNAGCILMGEHTPESGGDYAIGPSHTLPTGGAARWQSPVNVLDFLKVQSVVNLDRGELNSLIPVIEAFGEMEGFPAHAYGATVRREAR